MKNRRLTTYAVALGILVLGAGCAVTQETDAKPAAAAGQVQSDEHARKMLEAFLKNDAKTFVRVLPKELQKEFGTKEFENARASLTETLGRPISYQFDTTLEHPLLNVSVWKVRFERRGSEGETIRQEVLFRVISGVLDGQSRIISFNFL